MAQNPKTGQMQPSGFLFERSDLNNQVRVALFERWEREELMLDRSGNSSQSNTMRSFLSNKENVQEAFVTPPLKGNSAATPRAPMKQRKRSRKANLKPKKLVYSDGDSDAVISIADSGINSDSSISSILPFKGAVLRSNGPRNSRKSTAGKKAKAGDSLSANFEKIRLRSSNKENNINVIESFEKDTSENARVGSQSYLGFNPEAEILSQCASNLNSQDILAWLQPRRDVGLWIECCRKDCKKWRYVEEYHDPIDVPEIWYCEMNADKSIASCNIPEKQKPAEIEDDLIENKYNAGSIVLAHVAGFPWWPAMVDDCPNTFRYYELSRDSIKPTKYHVILFYENALEHHWLRNNCIKPFIHHKHQDLVKKTRYSVGCKQQLNQAYEIACNAVKMPILEKLQNYGFYARNTTFFDSNNNNSLMMRQNAMAVVSVVMNQSSGDEIPASPESNTHVTLKDYYTNVLLPKKRKTNNRERTGNSRQQFTL